MSKRYGRILGLSALIIPIGPGCIGMGRAPYDQVNPKAVEEVLAGTRTTASAAWWGFDEEDATEALQAAIRSGAGKLIVPNMGKPWNVEPIQLESNQEIIFDKGVVIAARKGKFQGRGDSLFTARDKENIILCGYGAELVMRKQDYRKPPYEKAEWRMCLSLQGCKDVKVLGLRLASSGGDGIYIGRGQKRKYCQDIHIKDVRCEDNYRQGISVITVRNLLIEDSVLRGTEGTGPAAGIDFEPNKSDEVLINCVVRNCLIEKNGSQGLLVVLGRLNAKSEPVSIRVENCRVVGNKHGMLRVTGTNVSGYVHLQGNEPAGKRIIAKHRKLKIRIIE